MVDYSLKMYLNLLNKVLFLWVRVFDIWCRACWAQQHSWWAWILYFPTKAGVFHVTYMSWSSALRQLGSPKRWRTMKILYNLKLRDNCDIGNFLIELCTSSPSSLIKTLAEQIKGIVLSPEVFDVLNKILKNDEENRSGEVQMLCELFSGERTSYRFQVNIPFVILGTTHAATIRSPGN